MCCDLLLVPVHWAWISGCWCSLQRFIFCCCLGSLNTIPPHCPIWRKRLFLDLYQVPTNFQILSKAPPTCTRDPVYIIPVADSTACITCRITSFFLVESTFMVNRLFWFNQLFEGSRTNRIFFGLCVLSCRYSWNLGRHALRQVGVFYSLRVQAFLGVYSAMVVAGLLGACL